MTSNDQHFLDMLSGVSADIRHFTNEVADATDRHINAVAASIRDAYISATWIPSSVKPAPPPRPRRIPIPSSLYDRVFLWVSRNRALTAALVSFALVGSAGLFVVWKGKGKKRRARRANNGARKEVVVLAGPPHSPLTKTIALDLERRGFVVYVLVGGREEEEIVERMERVDVRGLVFDVGELSDSNRAIQHLNSLLAHPDQAIAGAPDNFLNFTGLILAPDLVYPSGPSETITPDLWSDALNAKVLNTVATAQAFLPTVIQQKARILVLTPSIISSLKPALHSVQSAVVGALEGYTASLTAELAGEGVHVAHIKLGAFDFHNGRGRQSASDTVRAAWARSPQRSITFHSSSALSPTDSMHFGKGSPLRDLHFAVFDALTDKRPRRVWRVGKGSLAYDMLGSFAPRGLVGWMVSGGKKSQMASSASSASLDSSEHSSWEEVDTPETHSSRVDE